MGVTRVKLAIVDVLGLSYDGSTLDKRGLGGSESAVILLAAELQKIGFEVTVFCNCGVDSESTPGTYDGVRYIDNSEMPGHAESYDIVVVSRTVLPWLESASFPILATAKLRCLWLHDTFIDGDEHLEDLVVSGEIDHVFTLSDWHTDYILNAEHGKKRNFEVLKGSVFQTRNGAVIRIPEVDLAAKDPNHFVYNASATKGMVPLLLEVWPEIKLRHPDAHLTVIGGYYRFREGAEPDAQERTVRDFASQEELKRLDVTFTGVITQQQVAEILANATLMLYPATFPETFGISTLESLLYKTPVVTCRFGALEETALDLACYKIDYAVAPTPLTPDIDRERQRELFLEQVELALTEPYLLQQKQHYCDVVRDIAGWDTVALQWKEFLFTSLGEFMSSDEHREVARINEKVARVFKRTKTLPAPKRYGSSGVQRRVDIVTPFRNAKDYIGRCILSVAQQDYDNYAMHLVDDASDDGSAEEAQLVIESLPVSVRHKFTLIRNEESLGAVRNQLSVLDTLSPKSIAVLLDGDDWLICNPTVFHYYNDLYSKGIEFTYGSCWSLADDIPLVAQEYSDYVKRKKAYRSQQFNWRVPYTHLRTFEARHGQNLDSSKFKVDGAWMRAGADNPLFYEVIEKVDPHRVHCCREIVCVYNDINPLNDYKIRGDEQNNNASESYAAVQEKLPVSLPVKMKIPLEKRGVKIMAAIPTAKYIEVETFKSLWDQELPEGVTIDFEYSFGYDVAQVRNHIAEWINRGDYDYLLFLDSDIVLPRDAVKKMLAHDVDVVSGLYIQRIPNTHTLEVYMETQGGGCTNIPHDWLPRDQLVEIHACGMGCALIKANVFKKSAYPWFIYHHALTMEETVSEDVHFCLKIKDEGFRIWCDTSVKCSHKGTDFYEVEDKTLTRFRELSNQPLLPAPHVQFLASMPRKPRVVFDIGAAVLHWSKPARMIWPEARFVLFEAMSSVGRLYDECGFPEHYLGVLSDVAGKHVDFFENDFHPGGNSYYRENQAINPATVQYFSEANKRQLVTNTIDRIAQLNDLPKPDLVKMDVQGAELDILRGGVETFAGVRDFILELQHEDYNVGAPKADEVISYMEGLGYEVKSNFTRTNVDGDYWLSLRE